MERLVMSFLKAVYCTACLAVLFIVLVLLIETMGVFVVVPLAVVGSLWAYFYEADKRGG